MFTQSCKLMTKSEERIYVKRRLLLLLYICWVAFWNLAFFSGSDGWWSLVKYLGVKEEIKQVSFVKKNSHQQVSLHSIYLSDLSPNVHTVTVDSFVTIQVQVQVQSPKSKGLGVTLFCCATTHHLTRFLMFDLAQIFTVDSPDQD